MTGDIDVYGVFFPAFLLATAIAFAVVLVLRRLARLLPAGAGVWHRPLFTLATYTLVLHAVVAVSALWIP